MADTQSIHDTGGSESLPSPSKQERTRKFVLVDPSLTSTGGHYLEYAVRVLEAIDQFTELKPMLVSNVAFASTPFVHHSIEAHAKFRCDIWGQIFSSSENERQTLSESNSDYRHMLSKLSWLWAVVEKADELDTHLGRFGMTRHEIRWLTKIARVRQELLTLHGESENLESRWNSLLNSADDAHIDLFNKIEQIELSSNKAEIAREDIEGLVREFELDEEDHVFMPTTGWHDVAGLTQLMALNQSKTFPTFHLLFRRNIYECYPDEYSHGRNSVRDISHAFEGLLESSNGRPVKIYTDTDQLTAQYETVCSAPITTLPVPAPVFSQDTLDRSAEDSEDLILGYLGDARPEKGFQFLPGLLLKLNMNASDDHQNATIRAAVLRAQCYFAPGCSDIEIMKAHALLEANSTDRFEQIDGVLGAETYTETVSGLDAVLIPYDQRNYSARSSGIFVEALSANKPVIVPAGSWMANELDSRAYQYHRKQISDSDIVSKLAPTAIRWKVMGEEETAVSESSPRRVVRPNQLSFFTTETPPGATHLWIRFRVCSESADSHARVVVGARDEHERPVELDQVFILGGGKSMRSLVVPVSEDQRDAWISVSNAHAPTPFVVCDLEAAWINSTVPIARSAAGATFVNEGNFETRNDAFERAVTELIENYNDYRASACEIGKEYRSFHSAKTLVSMVGDTALAPKISD